MIRSNTIILLIYWNIIDFQSRSPQEDEVFLHARLEHASGVDIIWLDFSSYVVTFINHDIITSNPI